MNDVRTRKRGQNLGQSAIDRIGNQQAVARIRVFDYERKQAPEIVRVGYPEFVKPNPFFNPQPVTPIYKDFVNSQVKSAQSGVINLITREQAKAAEKTKSTIALTTVRHGVLGRVAYHSPGFGIPQKADILPISKPTTLLDKLFIWLNSMGRRVKK